MSSEASNQSLVDGADPALGMFHICRDKPCTYLGGPKSPNKKGLTARRVSAFAFADVTARANPVGLAAVPGQVVNNAYWSWQAVMGSAILRHKTALSALSVSSVVSSTVKGFVGFFCDKLLVVLRSAETGIVWGFCESIWEEYPTWFEWLVRLAAYGFVTQGFSLYLRLMAWARKNWKGEVKNGATATAGSPRSQPDPASDVDDSVCQSDLILMDINGAHRSLSSTPCRALSVDHVVLASEDADISHLPDGDNVMGVPLRRAHGGAYPTMRGHKMCAAQDCYQLGPLGQAGFFYFGNHISSALTPCPPKPMVKFEDTGAEKTARGKGCPVSRTQ